MKGEWRRWFFAVIIIIIYYFELFIILTLNGFDESLRVLGTP